MEIKEILRKKPFTRVMPYVTPMHTVSNGQTVEARLPGGTYTIISQEQFESELSPSGHVVNVRPDKMVYDADKNFKDVKSVAKIPLALQSVISTKQSIHLATNDIKFTLTEEDRSEGKEKVFVNFKQAWKDKNIHVHFYEMIESYLETGDAAMYFFRSDKKVGVKNFSFTNGDVLLPHYDEFGELILFGRLYRDYNDIGREVSKLDVIDKTEVKTYIKDGLFSTGIIEKWKLVGKPKPHGFDEIPVVYNRAKDVCWGNVQSLIDSVESCVSNMSENNRYYANMILFLKGNIGDGGLPDRDNAGKVLTGEEGSDAKFLASPESTNSQMNEIDLLMKQIFLGSFTVAVSPDTVKSSGDLPGITVKLLFSPATEKAQELKKRFDASVDKMVRLFKHGYGIESGKPSEYESLKVRGEIDIYIPQNDEELTRMINDSIFAGSLSKKTGAEANSLSVNGEYERVKKEQEEAAQAELNAGASLNVE